jgi:hypothetical protein
MRKRKYLDHTTVDVTVNDADYTLEIAVKSVGNDGMHTDDYVDDWVIQRVLDAWGDPVPPGDEAEIIHAIGNDAELIEQIQEQLDERLDDMRDIDYDGGHDL